jgi:hypothetical protein
MANIAEVLKELQSERDRLDQAIKALQPLISMNGQPPAVAGREGMRRTLSAAARRRIAAAARARWARVKAGESKTNSGRPRTRVVSLAARRKMAAAQRARWEKVRAKTGSPLKRTLSIAGRRRIAAAQRARWAAVKAKQKKAA